MVFARRLLSAVLLLGLGSLRASRADAAPITYTGTFANDNTAVAIGFSTTTAQNYTFTTTSFAMGGFIPVLTLFNASGGVPIAFAETEFSDVSINQILNPGSYLLFLTEDPNVFTSTLAAGTLFADQPTITGDICGVSGGKFLNIIDCSQRTGNYAVTVNSTAVAATPEPATWLLLLPPVAFAFAMRRRPSFGEAAC